MRIDLGSEPMLTLPAKEVLYRIAHEALQNIAKHAQAKNVELCLHAEESWILLEVADDGIGFAPHGRFPGYLGLQTMRERALRMGGLLEIASEPSHGTRVPVQIPVAPPGG